MLQSSHLFFMHREGRKMLQLTLEHFFYQYTFLEYIILYLDFLK